MKKKPIPKKEFSSQCYTKPQFASEVTELLFKLNDRAHLIVQKHGEEVGVPNLAALLVRLSTMRAGHPKALIYPDDAGFDKAAVLREIDPEINELQRQVINNLYDVTKPHRIKPVNAVFKLL